MLSVVALHAQIAFSLVPPHDLRYAFLLSCFFKFATIGFFVASGFLFARGLESRAPWSYVARRARATLVPWLFWYFAFVFVLLTKDVLHGDVVLRADRSLLTVLGEKLYLVAFFTSFWFVPNLLVCFSVLTLLRRWINHRWFFLLASAASLVYGLNLYTGWFLSFHGTALFGYIIHVWLGVQLYRHHAAVRRTLSHVPVWLLIGGCLLLCRLSLAESLHFLRAGSIDSQNTLRFSNQAYSLGIVCLFVRIGALALTGCANLQSATFGIYLIHPLTLYLMVTALHLALHRYPTVESTPMALISWLVVAACGYFISLRLTQFLLVQPRLAFLVSAGGNGRLQRA